MFDCQNGADGAGVDGVPKEGGKDGSTVTDMDTDETDKDAGDQDKGKDKDTDKDGGNCKIEMQNGAKSDGDRQSTVVR